MKHEPTSTDWWEAIWSHERLAKRHRESEPNVVLECMGFAVLCALMIFLAIIGLTW